MAAREVRRRRCRLLAVLLAAALTTVVLDACQQKVVYHRYEHVDDTGWEKGDTLRFHVAPLTESGTYLQEIELRIDKSFPFQGITLLVDEQVQPGGQTRRHRIDCSLIDRQGHMKGKGVSYFQYSFPIASTTLAEGDSLSFRITHDMKRESMPGINDVGIRITKE